MSKSKSKDMGERKRRKQIISPKLSSSSIYALKQNQNKTKALNKQESYLTIWSSIEEEEEEKSDSHFSKTSTKQSVTFKSQISQMVTTEKVRFQLVLDDQFWIYENIFNFKAISESFKRGAPYSIQSAHKVDQTENENIQTTTRVGHI